MGRSNKGMPSFTVNQIEPCCSTVPQQNLWGRQRQTVGCTKCVNSDTRDRSLLPVSHQKPTLVTDQMSCFIINSSLVFRQCKCEETMRVRETRQLSQMRCTLFGVHPPSVRNLIYLHSPFPSPFPFRVYMERSVFLPGVVVSLLPHLTGRARLWYLLLLQD